MTHPTRVGCAFIGLAGLLAVSCAAPGSPSAGESRHDRPPVVMLILDGFGIGPGDAGDAIAEAFERQPDGLLARALRGEGYPLRALSAVGKCVGLPPKMIGNSEAGHNALCGGGPVQQWRTFIDAQWQGGMYHNASGLHEAMEISKREGRPLHVFTYMAEKSSNGFMGHAKNLVRMAAARGVTELHLHIVCDGRSDRSCEEMVAEVGAVTREVGLGTFATALGRNHCIARAGVSDKTREAVVKLTGARTAADARIARVVAGLRYDAEANLAPRALAGGKAVADGDPIVLLLYRRDVSEGLVRVLRDRIGADDPPHDAGPRVYTFGRLAPRAIYDDDPRLTMAFDYPKQGGLLHARLTAAGLRQLRISESKKAAHVTYFCDLEQIPDSELYRRYHPTSPIEDAAVSDGCLRAEAATARALQAVQTRSADFVLMNLPNADLLGHTGLMEPTVRAVMCLDRKVTAFAEAARKEGAAIFITADHGNADGMLYRGRPNENHTDSPVPFIAVHPEGAPPYRFKPDTGTSCVGRATWTVLEALGLAPDVDRSLVEPSSDADGR